MKEWMRRSGRIAMVVLGIWVVIAAGVKLRQYRLAPSPVVPEVTQAELDRERDLSNSQLPEDAFDAREACATAVRKHYPEYRYSLTPDVKKREEGAFTVTGNVLQDAGALRVWWGRGMPGYNYRCEVVNGTQVKTLKFFKKGDRGR